MYNFLRAQYQNIKSYSIKMVTQSGISAIAGIFLLAALIAPRENFAATGFNGATMTTTTNVCSGSQATVGLVPINTCSLFSGSDWSATYFVDSSHDGGSTWTLGIATGAVGYPATTLTYTTPVFNVSSPDVVYYRIRFTGLTGNCLSGGSTYTSLTATVNVFPQPQAITGPHTVCQGTNITLTDPTAFGTWSSAPVAIASVSSAGVVSGNSPGTATVVYTLAGGCSSTYSVTVNPAAPTISGPPSVCVGNTATYLLSAPATGTWASSVPSVGTVDPTGVFTSPSGGAIGTTTLTFTVSSTGCFSTFLLTVNPIPAPIACIPSTPFCEGSSITLCDATAPSVGTFSGGSLSVATITSGGVVTGMGGGTTTVTYTVGGCFVTAVLTVNPLPSFIGGTPFVCVNSTTTLTDGTAGGTWTGDNPPVATVGSGLGDVHGVSAGLVNVTYTITSSGCFRTIPVTVYALPAPIVGPDSVCIGSTVTLTDPSGGGTWTSTVPPIATIGSISGVVTPGFTPGTTTISYTFTSTGCASTVILTVNPVPIPSNGIGTLCPGETALLTNSSGGSGTWTSGNPSIATVGATSGILSAVTGGIVGITYTLSTGCFVVDQETVNPAPAPITGIPNTCIGFTTHLSDATTGGTWFSSNGSVATVDGSGNVSGLASGVTTIIYTLGTGCSTSVVVTVDGIPTPIIGPFAVCQGPLNTITLSHAVPGGTWSSSDVTIAPVSLGSGVVTGLNVGTATITYTLASGCMVTAVVTVNPVPPANTGTLYTCAGGTTSLSNIVGGGTWSSENNLIATVGSSTGVVTGVSGGVVHITYTLQGGCAAVSSVTVYALPAILGTPLVCPGSSILLTGVPAGGFWSSLVPAIASVGSLSGIVTGGAEGTTTITYTLITTCYTTAVVTVQALPNPTTGVDHMCLGLTTTLSNSTVGGGTWMSLDTSIALVDTFSGVVTGNHAGVTTIIFTATTTGCTASYTVTVNPLPLAISGPTEVCANDSITLTDPSPGGTWSSSGIYATVNGTSGVVTGVSAGVETIVYTLPTGCITTYQVTVNPLPSPISGPGTVCYGYTISLSSAPTGGAWAISPTSVATISPTGDVTGVGTTGGTAIVTYTVTPPGCSVYTIITVNPLPAPITGLLNICLNDSTILHDATPGGTWSVDPGPPPGILIAVINPTTGVLGTVTAGTVTITYTLPTGCYVTAVETVNPIPQPILGPLEVCVGGTVTLFDVTTGGSWSSSNTVVAIIGSADGILTGMAPGTSFITYTLPSSCPRVAIVTVDANPATISGITDICQGNTTTLHDVTPGGTWSSSNPAIAPIIMTTGLVLGIDIGSATITYTLPSGCYTTIDVHINPVPNASDIVGNRVICVNDLTVFSDPVNPLGTWSISPSTPGIVAIVSASGGVIQGVNPGVAVISYTLPTGCETFIRVTVNALPTISGPSVLCAGGNTVTLTGTPPGGTWSSLSTIVATIGSSSGVVISGTPGTTAATTVITYTAPGTGCKATRTITVNPNPNPITGFSQLCLGSTTIISTVTAGGTWSSLNSGIVSVTPIPGHPDSALITAVATGTTTIVYTLSTGCSAIFNVTVNPLPLPITGPNQVCVGSAITLTDASPGGVWTSNNVAWASVTPLTGIVTGVSAHTAIITYTLSTGCYVTYLITVNPVPMPIYGNNSICVGFTTALHDTTASGTPAVGTWSTVGTAAGTISTTGVVTGTAAGVITVHFTFATGCYAQYLVTVHPIPTVSIVNYPSQICKHSSVVIAVTGADTYTWAPPAGLNTTVGDIVTASPTITTTYTVTGTTIYGCSDTATVTVTVDSLLNHIKITGQDTICKGACTQLIASGRDGTYFNWRPNTNLSCTICDTVVACPLNTITYNALAIDSFGCRDSLDFTVTVMPLPKIIVTPNPIMVCRGSSTQLHAIDSAAAAGYATRFAWFPNIFISCDTCPNPFVSDTFNLVYRVTGITPFGCVDSIKVPVSVLDSSFNSINKDTTICIGSTAQLYATSFSPDGARSDFYWLDPVATMSNRYIANPTVSPVVTTTYRLLITPNVCFPDTLYTTVQVVPLPSITITPASATVAAGTPVSLTATIGNDIIIKDYTWLEPDPNTLSCVDCYHTIATPSVTTTYTFTATSVYGCTATANATIHIFCESSEVFIPNTFTPNGDGMNDRFYISGKGISTITKFQVFNRWGELVFENHNIVPNDPSAGWDGQYKGVVLEPDVFVYLIEATCNLGEHFTYKGDISIVR